MAIQRRVDRVSVGHADDRKLGRDSVWELRVDVGPGYRVYYARDGRSRVMKVARALGVRFTAQVA